MPCNSKDILDSDSEVESEHGSQMDVDVLPTFEPQTPGSAQIQYYTKNSCESYPFPFYAFSQHAIQFAFTQTPYTPSMALQMPSRM